MIHKVGYGQERLFERGGHSAMMSNQEKFIKISKDFSN